MATTRRTRLCIHVCHTAIGRGAHDDKIDEGGDDDKVQGMAKNRIAKVNLRINGR